MDLFTTQGLYEKIRGFYGKEKTNEYFVLRENFLKNIYQILSQYVDDDTILKTKHYYVLIDTNNQLLLVFCTLTGKSNIQANQYIPKTMKTLFNTDYIAKRLKGLNDVEPFITCFGKLCSKFIELNEKIIRLEYDIDGILAQHLKGVRFIPNSQSKYFELKSSDLASKHWISHRGVPIDRFVEGLLGDANTNGLEMLGYYRQDDIAHQTSEQDLKEKVYEFITTYSSSKSYFDTVKRDLNSEFSELKENVSDFLRSFFGIISLPLKFSSKGCYDKNNIRILQNFWYDLHLCISQNLGNAINLDLYSQVPVSFGICFESHRGNSGEPPEDPPF